MALRPSLTTRHPAADQSVKLWNLLTSLKVRVTTFTTTTQQWTTPRAASAHERSRACSESETRPHPPPRVGSHVLFRNLDRHRASARTLSARSTPSRSCRWPRTSPPSTSAGGSALPPPRPGQSESARKLKLGQGGGLSADDVGVGAATSLAPTSPTTRWTRCRTRSTSCSAPSSSMTAGSER